ncbi:MAG: OFA family MFS transporter [Myxococcota bacterium]|nr:OFA family MFS transporter [Myxococcota bacterium]
MAERVPNRWVIVMGAIVVQLCLGAIYAWSAFTGKLTALDGAFLFTKTQTQVIFSMGIAFFAVAMALIAGKWQAKAGPRIVAITGGIVLGLGYLLASVWTDFWGILIGVGVLGGLGIGIAYVCPIAVCVKWFPDKKGLITGLAVMGFGFGALIWVKLTSGFKFGEVNLTPGWTGLFGDGWTVPQVFRLYGVLFAVLVPLAALVFKNPPAGWQPQGWTPPAPKAGVSTGVVDFSISEMIRTSQFWGLFAAFLFSSAAGLMVIGIIKLFGTDALTGGGMELKAADVVTGTAMGLFYALANGLGRPSWGAISEKLGRRNSILVMLALQGCMMIAMYFIGNTAGGLYLGATIIGFNFGGSLALFPAITADFYGNKSVGSNYPMVFMAYGVAGIVGPILGGMMGDAKAWMWAFIPTGIACMVGAVIMLMMKPPAKA